MKEPSASSLFSYILLALANFMTRATFTSLYIYIYIYIYQFMEVGHEEVKKEEQGTTFS